MVINTNISALNAWRSMKVVSEGKDKASQKLSSGYKINNAADDAAGLAISEKMRNQIRGLNQASRNSEDGISLIQTAEGAMQEISEMVKRIRELAVQAANDTNTLEDRQKIQMEVDQLTGEINATADKTEFNTKKLIDGSLGGTGFRAIDKEIMESLYGSWITDAFAQILSQTGLSLNNDVNLKVEFTSMPAGVGASMTSSSDGINYTLKLNSNFLDDSMIGYGPSGPAVVPNAYYDRIITHEIMHMMEAHNVGLSKGEPIWFKEGLAEAVSGASDTRFPTLNLADVQAALDGLVSNPNDSGLNAYSGGYLAVMYMDSLAGGGSIDTFLNNLQSSADFETAMQTTYGMNSSALLSQMQTLGAAGVLSAIGVTTPGTAYALGGATGNAQSIISNTGATTAVDTENGDVLNFNGHDVNITWTSGAPLLLKTGANTDQQLYVSIPGMTKDNLFGSSPVSVLSYSDANDAINAADDAVDYVSKARANLGAYQNRLEHTVKNLDISQENLSSAESRIRDTDMAKEMMNYTKDNILLQAGMSMLSQANQLPERMLQLLG